MADLKNDIIKNHLIEPGGSMGIFVVAYPEHSIFKDVQITVSNNKKHEIMIRLTDTGLIIDLVRNQ